MGSKFNFLIASPEPWDVAAPMEKRQPQISASDPQQINAKRIRLGNIYQFYY
jgi:hypothetical protein